MGIKKTRVQPIAPLVVLRLTFGAVLLISTIRFIAKGWIVDFYVAPRMHFPFYGFGWVRALPAWTMYGLFALMILSSICILLGLFYRWAVAAFLLAFTYVELIDKSYYLNHYYFVSLFTFLLLLVPANRYFSLDVLRKPSLRAEWVPVWTIRIFQVQLCLVYFFAGLSKLNSDWLLEAMPLRIWLPAGSSLPLIGPLLGKVWVAYLFSWFGAAFDLFIAFFMLYGPTRKVAYVFVILFHVLTALLFKIGMFPWIMIAATVIFFSTDWHRRLLGKISTWIIPGSQVRANISNPPGKMTQRRERLTYTVLGFYFLLQVLVPLRYLLYPGHLFWTEQGYRFSWRVMLMEKSGTCFFYVRDPATGRRGEVDNGKYLTPLQERMMATQPDMMLQYAHYLGEQFPSHPITVESYVTLNGSGSRLYIDSTVDLSRQKESWSPIKWILPFQKNQ